MTLRADLHGAPCPAAVRRGSSCCAVDFLVGADFPKHRGITHQLETKFVRVIARNVNCPNVAGLFFQAVSRRVWVRRQVANSLLYRILQVRREFPKLALECRGELYALNGVRARHAARSSNRLSISATE